MKNLKFVFGVMLVFTCSMSVGLAGESTPAEEMTLCLPDETIGYIASSGMDNVGEAFEKTAIGQVLTSEESGAIWEAFWGRAMVDVEKRSGEEGIKAGKLLADLLKIICKRPFIAGVCKNSNGGEMPISGFLIVDAGGERKQINQIFKEYKKFDKDDKISKKVVGPCKMNVLEICKGQNVYWGFAGKKFVLVFNDNDGSILKNIFWPSKELPQILKKIPQNGDALVIEYDYQALLSLLEKPLKKAHEYKKMKSIFEGLGLTGIGDVGMRVGFSGADVIVDEAVELSSPRTGLFSCYKSIDLAMFDLVDPKAMKAGTFNVDAAKFSDIIRKLLKNPDKNEHRGLISRIAAFEKIADVKIGEIIPGSFEGEGVFYTIPAGVMMDSPSGGFVGIGCLKDDGVKLKQNLKTLGQFAADQSGKMLQISEVAKGDVSIEVWTAGPLAMMQIVPSWAIVDGYFVVASNPALCGKAINRIMDKDRAKDSLRSTEAFKSVVKGLPDGLTSLVYTDSKVQFKHISIQVQRFWPIVTMSAKQTGINFPVKLPNFDEAIKDLEPSASYSGFDENGSYSHYRGSGIEIGTAAAGGAVAAAIIMPAIKNVRKFSRRVSPVKNLRKIGAACHMYANDNQGKMPPSLCGPELKKYLEPGKLLVSPRKPKHFEGPSYIYVEGQKLDMNSQNIAAYENPKYLDDMTIVLLLDGSVKHMHRNAFIKNLNATYERLGKEAPEIKFRGQILREKREKKRDREFQELVEKSRTKLEKQQREQKKCNEKPKNEVKPKAEPVKTVPVDPKKCEPTGE